VERESVQMAHLHTYRVARGASARAEFWKSLKTALKWAARWRTSPEHATPGLALFTNADISGMSGKGQSYLGPIVVCDPWSPTTPSSIIDRTLRVPASAWKDGWYRMVDEALHEIYDQNLEERVKGPMGGGPSAPVPEREAILDKYMMLMFHATHPKESDTAKSSTQVVRSVRGGDFTNKSNNLRAEAKSICYAAVAAKRADAKSGNPDVADTSTKPTTPATENPWRQNRFTSTNPWRHYRTADGRPLPPVPRRGVPATDEEQRATDKRVMAAAAQDMWEELQPTLVADEMLKQFMSEAPMEMTPEVRASLDASSSAPPRRRRSTSTSSSTSSGPCTARRVRPRGDGSRQ